MDSLDVGGVVDKRVLSQSIATQTSLSPQSSDAVASTVLALAGFQRCDGNLAPVSTFLPSRLTLLPPGYQPHSSDPLKYFCDLALSAEAAAASISCSSILAGQSSESDEMGDVAIYLGEGDYGPLSALKVLEKLGLHPWAKSGQIETVSLSFQHCLPPSVSSSSAGPLVDDLVTRLGEMKDKYCFRISTPNTLPMVVYFLIGRIIQGNVSTWGGLSGIGVWSDN